VVPWLPTSTLTGLRTEGYHTTAFKNSHLLHTIKYGGFSFNFAGNMKKSIPVLLLQYVSYTNIF
jgi:hypothetical protein